MAPFVASLNSRTEERGSDLKYGSDIEFFLEYGGAPAPAGLILPFQGMLGTDNHGNARGMRDTAEIRTRASADITDIVRDITRALNVLWEHLALTPSKKIRTIPLLFLTGHFHHGRSIGGHVHFSSLWFNQENVLASQRLLSSWAIPFMHQYDSPEQIIQRTRAGYFTSGDAVRIKSEQMGVENFHWEYRQWGSFLISPLYCYTVLALSKLIVMNVLRASTKEEIAALPQGDKFTPESPAKMHDNLLGFKHWTPDLRYLPQAILELESTREEMKERWSADFMELWRDDVPLPTES